MRKILLGIGAAAGIIVAVVLIRTFTVSGISVEAGEKTEYPVDRVRAFENLSRAVQIKTISYDDRERMDRGAFLDFHAFLKKTYPKAHRVLKKEVINGMTLLYRWEGSDSSKDPIMVMSHIDVVPAEQRTLDKWTNGPFSGRITDNHIWGRGTMDVKLGITSIMEAVEYLAGTGFIPERSVYMAFGHDEEIGGQKGNGAIAKILKSRGVKLHSVLDEGGTITIKMMPGLDRPVALIGIAEKGYCTLILKAEGAGGHSSMPPKKTTVGKLASAIHKLEKNPFPAKLQGPPRLMLSSLAHEMPFALRMVMSNIWLFKPVLKAVLSGKPSTDAMLRTTTAATMIEGSNKENILPKMAMARVNFRVLPGESIDSVLKRVKDIIDDESISIEPTDGSRNPSTVSDVESEQFKDLVKTILEVDPEVVTAPYLVMGGTDSRHYQEIAKQTFRFLPMRLEQEDLKRIHGINERIEKDNYMENIYFFITYLQNMQ